jgi:hypothetical protein
MYQLQQLIFSLLREGVSTAEILIWLEQISSELVITNQYLKPIKESEMRP